MSNPEPTQKCPLHSIVKKSYFQQVGAKTSITSENKKQIFKENYGSSSGQCGRVEDISSSSGQCGSVEDIGSSSGHCGSVEDIGSSSGQSRSVEEIVERYNTRINNVKSSFDITFKRLTHTRGLPLDISFKESIDKILRHRNLIFVTSHHGPYQMEFIPIDTTRHLRKEQLSTNLEFVALVLHIVSVKLEIPSCIFIWTNIWPWTLWLRSSSYKSSQPWSQEGKHVHKNSI